MRIHKEDGRGISETPMIRRRSAGSAGGGEGKRLARSDDERSEETGRRSEREAREASVGSKACMIC